MSLISQIIKTNNVPRCKNSWELLNGILYVNIELNENCQSTLLCGFLEIDISKSGKLLGFDTVFLDKRNIRPLDSKLPVNYFLGEVILNLDWNENYDVQFYYSKKSKIVYLEFLGNAKTTYKTANSIYIDVTEGNDIAGIWVTHIEYDFMYAKKLLRFLIKKVVGRRNTTA